MTQCCSVNMNHLHVFSFKAFPSLMCFCIFGVRHMRKETGLHADLWLIISWRSFFVLIMFRVYNLYWCLDVIAWDFCSVFCALVIIKIFCECLSAHAIHLEQPGVTVTSLETKPRRCMRVSTPAATLIVTINWCELSRDFVGVFPCLVN